MPKHDYEKSYEQLMLEAKVEYMEWLTEAKRTRKENKKKFAAQRKATLEKLKMQNVYIGY